MTHSLTLHLDEFLQDALEDYARERHGSASSVVRLAALYWLADRGGDRPAWRVPRFRRDAAVAGAEVGVALDDDTWAALEEEARQQGLRPELVAQHAVLYFLADLDSGRVAARLGDLADLDD
jgi:predicted DNA-binding ribbon-helix-helix protein